MIYDFLQTDKSERYKLISDVVVPRPIAWIVTQDEGIINIAPFSFFTALSSEPPTVMVSIGHKSDNSPKDTLYNLRKNKKCVICSVKEEDLRAMHFSSEPLAKGESEAKKFNIETEKILENFPPMIKSAPSAMFCTLLQEVELEGSKTLPIFLKIEQMYVDEKYKKHLLARVGKAYASYSKDILAPTIPKI